MDNNNDNNGSCVNRNMIVGVGSIVVGFVLMSLVYKTLLHIAFIGAGIVLVSFGLMKLCIVKDVAELRAKVRSIWLFCIARCKSWCSCANGCIGCKCDDKANCRCK